MSLILYSQLHERLKDGVWRLLQDLFGHGSIVSLQADGGPAEYTIRVRVSNIRAPRPVFIVAREFQPSP